MLIGERTERIDEKVKRHINEMLETKCGWENELEYAVENDNKEYERYCKFMIEIAKNTLDKLMNF